MVKGREYTFNCLPAFDIAINRNYSSEIIGYTNSGYPSLRQTQTFKDNDDLLINGPYLCRKITSIEPVHYDGGVYTLQVVDDNSYIVEGCSARN